MTTVDDQIRHALDAGIPEADAIDATALATQLAARGTARRRTRRRTRIAGAGAVVLVLLLGATVALRDRSTVQVVADGPTEVAPDGPSLRRPLATSLAHLASVQEPTLHNSVAGHDDLVFVGEVTAVGSSRPVSTTVPTGPNADIPMPTYDFSPVEVRVVERLRVAPGADLPDPVRLRLIDMVELRSPLANTGTVPGPVRPPLDELLPVGSMILVFAAAPVDVGDGLAATPTVVFPVTDEGVIDEDGHVTPLDEIRDRLGGDPAGSPPTTTTAEQGSNGRHEGDRVRVSVEVVHCEPLTTGAVTVRVWEERDAAIDPDNPIPDQPAWRVLYQELQVVDVEPLRDATADEGAARSRITVEVPRKAAQWLTTFQEQGGPIWAGPTRDSDVSCAGHPSFPTR